MNGAIGSYIKTASEGVPAARRHLEGLFTEDFQILAGWTALLDTKPGGSVAALLARSGAWWELRNFHALYVAGKLGSGPKSTGTGVVRQRGGACVSGFIET